MTTVLDEAMNLRAIDLNAAGQVLFSMSFAGNAAHLWTPTTPNGTSGTLVELPYFRGGAATSTEAYGLNNLGDVVGFATEDFGEGGYAEYSVLWHNGVVYDINGPDAALYTLRHAEAINDAGQIVGYGDDLTTYGHAFLMTPSSEPDVAISDATVTEGNDGTRTASFTVTLSAASSQPVTVAYATADATAAAGSDYRAASGTLTIPAGQTTGTITVLVNGDRLPEANETFSVNLSGVTNAVIGDGQGVGTIMDDEPRISIGDVTKKEGRKGHQTLFTFTVTLSAAYDQPVTVSFRTADGTATTSNGDYTAKSGTLTFQPGETTKTVTISVKGDSKREANEYFYVDLFNSSPNSLFAKSRGIGTILNDD